MNRHSCYDLCCEPSSSYAICNEINREFILSGFLNGYMSFELCHEKDKSTFHTIESFFRQMRRPLADEKTLYPEFRRQI